MPDDGDALNVSNILGGTCSDVSRGCVATREMLLPFKYSVRCQEVSLWKPKIQGHVMTCNASKPVDNTGGLQAKCVCSSRSRWCSEYDRGVGIDTNETGWDNNDW